MSMKDDSPFVFAGLWEGWKDPSNGEWLHTCTIITGEVGSEPPFWARKTVDLEGSIVKDRVRGGLRVSHAIRERNRNPTKIV